MGITRRDHNEKGWPPRFRVEYCRLNKVMKADRWSMPHVDVILESLGGSTNFSSIDLFSGYWQIRLDEACKELTTFRCRHETFQLEVMPFGLMNTPATLQRVMDNFLHPFDFVKVYIDAIVIFSPTKEDHVHHRERVLEVLEHHGLKMKLK